MATVKQLALRLKYAKASIVSLTKKLNGAKVKAKALDAELKKVKAAGKMKTKPRAAAKRKPMSRKSC